MAAALPVPLAEPEDVESLSWEERKSSVLAEGVQRMHAEVRRMRSLGIIDEAGDLLREGLPSDMSPEVERDFGG